jgi:hypothetical protein
VSFHLGVFRPGLVTRSQVFLAAKTAIAAGLAWVAALAADPHSRPYFAPVAVLLVVQPTVYMTPSRGPSSVWSAWWRGSLPRWR